MKFENLYYRLHHFYGQTIYENTADGNVIKKHMIRFSFCCYTPNKFEIINDWKESIDVLCDPTTLLNPWEFGYNELKKMPDLTNIKDDI